MPKRKEITVTSKVIRHNPQLSRLVTIPLDKIEPWKLTGTTTVEGTIKRFRSGPAQFETVGRARVLVD